MPNVVTSKANSAPGSSVVTRQEVNQTNGPRRFQPTKRRPFGRFHTAKHSGLQRAIPLTSLTAAYTAAGGAWMTICSDTDSTATPLPWLLRELGGDQALQLAHRTVK